MKIYERLYDENIYTMIYCKLIETDNEKKNLTCANIFSGTPKRNTRNKSNAEYTGISGLRSHGIRAWQERKW